MINGRRILCIVPARAGSKGLPGKNIRPLGGKPLLAWPIAAAKASAYIDHVIISTDSQAFADIAVAHGADCPFLRPAELASDTAPSLGYILHALDTLEAMGSIFDYVAILEPTSPLTEASDVDAAIEALVAAAPAAESIVGIMAMETNHPAFAVTKGGDGRIAPYGAATFANLPRRQDLEPVFCLDGSLYISTVEAVRREGGFCHDRTIGFEMPRHKGFEVDDLIDFLCIEAVMAHADLIDAKEAHKP